MIRLILASYLTAIAGIHGGYALTIQPIFDNSIQNDPQAATIEATINSAIGVYEASFSDPISVQMEFQETTMGLAQNYIINNGGPNGNASNYIVVNYSDYRAHLLYNATTEDDAKAIAYIPNQVGNPVNGAGYVFLRRPLARAVGFTPDNSDGPDGLVSLNTSIMNLSASQNDTNKFSLFSAVSHEIDEVLGFGSALDLIKLQIDTASAIEPEDLFRYTGAGARSFSSDDLSVSYFSLDGISAIARFNQNTTGDCGDWYGDTLLVQNAFATRGAAPNLMVEMRVLDVIGYHPINAPIWVDFSAAAGDGRYEFPFNTLANAVNAVASEGTIEVKPSTSTETITISKPMQIIAYRGTASIGH